jgi:glycosyltransferase involved in cell wall biosynthesis
MKPLVSILIPAYNAEPWIADTIQSALWQTWPNKEIIVVDDGSRDQTLSVAQQFASKSVSVVTQENLGASAARNTAIGLSQGSYIQWLDADDLLSPDKITKQMAAVEQSQTRRTLFSSGWGYFIYRPSMARFVPTRLWGDLSPVEWLVRKMSHNLHMMNATWLVSRELTESAGPWDTRLSLDDDGEYFCRVLLASEGTQFITDVKSYYRMSGCNSLSKVDRSNKKLESLWLSMQLHIGYLRSLEDSERARSACVTYLQNWLKCFYPDRLDIVEQAEKMAASLGGRLEFPRLRWKYDWIRPIFGYELAKRAQFLLPEIKWSIASYWDKALFLLGNGKPFAGIRECSSGTRADLRPNIQRVK